MGIEAGEVAGDIEQHSRAAAKCQKLAILTLKHEHTRIDLNVLTVASNIFSIDSHYS
jgi:hypothetical protein